MYYNSAVANLTPEAPARLGLLYAQGRYSTFRDMDIAFPLYCLGSALGDGKAAYEAGRCLTESDCIFHDPANAERFFKLASSRGYQPDEASPHQPPVQNTAIPDYTVTTDETYRNHLIEAAFGNIGVISEIVRKLMDDGSSVSFGLAIAYLELGVREGDEESKKIAEDMEDGCF